MKKKEVKKKVVPHLVEQKNKLYESSSHIPAISAWAIIILVAIMILSSFFDNVIVFLITQAISSALLILFLYGFYLIGKKHSKFLKIACLIFMIVEVLFLLFSFFILPDAMAEAGNNFMQGLVQTEQITGLSSMDVFDENSNLGEEARSAFVQELFLNGYFRLAMGFILKLVFLLVFTVMLYGIFLGVGLLKIRKHVKYAKVAGIFSIVGGATLILFGIGLILMLVSLVFQIIILFRARKN